MSSSKKRSRLDPIPAESNLPSNIVKKARLDRVLDSVSSSRAPSEEISDNTPVDHDSRSSTPCEEDGAVLTRNKHGLGSDLASQPVRTGNANQIGNNAAADNGIIESVTCVNFMCHDRLHVDFGPLINFVVGKNGSGKSAVLTGITLCLGAKASATNRGGSLRSFIKEGRDQSSVIVRLKNMGDGSYHYDRFGPSIIIERHFSKQGTSGFRIKTAVGKLVSSKRRDVDEIVEHFCLQMDNPLNVLSQDNARQFLNSSSATVKYKFFVQGVQLEALDHDYKLVEEVLEGIETKIATHQSHIHHLKREAETAKSSANVVRKHEEIRRLRRKLRNQMIWAQVVEQEEILEALDKSIEEEGARIEKAQNSIQEKTEFLEYADVQLAQEKEALVALQAEEESLAKAVSAADRKYQDAKAKVLNVHHEERIARGNLAEAKTVVDDVKVKIAAEEKRLAETTGEVQQQKQRDYDALAREIDTMESKIAAIRTQQPELATMKDDIERELIPKTEQITAKQVEIRTVQSEIQRLRSGRGNRYEAYHPNMARMMEEIARERRFQNKPIGPLGEYIRLQDPRYSSLLERFLGKAVSAFIVTSHDDMEILLDLIKRCRVVGSTVYKTQPRSERITHPRPDASFRTLADIIEISNTAVWNQIAVVQNLEQTILIDNYKEAVRIMEHPAPAHVLRCITLHPHPRKRGEGIIITSRESGFSTNPLFRHNGPSRLATDVQSQIASRQQMLEDVKIQLRSLQEAGQEVQSRLNVVVKDIRDGEQELRTLDRSLRASRVTQSHLRKELDRFDMGNSVLLDLQTLLADAEAKVEHHGSQFGTLSVAKTEYNEQCNGLLVALKEEQRKQQTHLEKVMEARRKVAQKEDSRRIALSDKNEAHDELQQAEREKEHYEGRRATQVEYVSDITKSAVQHAPERVDVPPGETYDSLDSQYKALSEQLSRVEKNLGMTTEEIYAREARTYEAYQSAKTIAQDLKSTQRELKLALLERIRRWRGFQKRLSARTRINFSYLLSERGFRGRMLIDHQNKALALHVEPDDTRKHAAGRKPNTLSGGEKSFASICMLLAIWEAMGSSIRCLDEFDVFMDNVNRAISTNMLISAARKSVSRQYILITPNAIEGRANVDKDVKVIRLTDPRQLTLDGTRRA